MSAKVDLLRVPSLRSFANNSSLCSSQQTPDEAENDFKKLLVYGVNENYDFVRNLHSLIF